VGPWGLLLAKLQVIQAMQLGVPVVSTPIGVEGVHCQDGKECLVASSAEQFAEQLVRLHRDCHLWRLVAEGGARVAQEQFSIGQARAALLEVRLLLRRASLGGVLLTFGVRE
jgi:glycosyltransferase involved in cell wall biosynthesis